MPVGHMQSSAHMPGKNSLLINKERMVFQGVARPSVVTKRFRVVI